MGSQDTWGSKKIPSSDVEARKNPESSPKSQDLVSFLFSSVSTLIPVRDKILNVLFGLKYMTIPFPQAPEFWGYKP